MNLPFSICDGATLNDYSVSNIISTALKGTVQRTYLYISSDPLRRANTRSDVSSPFRLHWIVLGQISQGQGNTWGHDEVHRLGWWSTIPSPEQLPCQVSCSPWYIHDLIRKLVDICEGFLKKKITYALFATIVLRFIEKWILTFKKEKRSLNVLTALLEVTSSSFYSYCNNKKRKRHVIYKKIFDHHMDQNMKAGQLGMTGKL